MTKGEARARMTAGAMRLLAERGPAGASFGDVLAATGTSRGSTYHHFPGGKREMYREALDLASDRALRYLEPVRGQPPGVVVGRFFEMWRELLEETDLQAGCAVLAVAVAGIDEASVEHSGSIFRSWRSYLSSLLVDGGTALERADLWAATVIASAEGAVALARAEHSLEPFELVAQTVIRCAEAG